MKRTPPSLSSLRPFVSAARLLSFSGAAGELGLSPSAVTQSIGRLEDAIGTLLFTRAARSVSLTPAGHKLFATAAAALREIDLTIESIAPRHGSLVKLTAPPTWTALWLMPRLTSFTQRFPDVQVEVDASSTVVDIEANGIDLAVRYAENLPGHFKRVALFEQCFVPVCSAATATRLRSVADLSKERLLHESDTTRWTGWLNGATHDPALAALSWDGATGMYFSQGALAVAAATRDLGVALTEPGFVQEQLRLRQLVQPFPYRWYSGHRYHIAWSARQPLPPGVRVFIDWLKAECAAAE